MEKSKVEGVGKRWGWRRGRGRKKGEGKKGWEMEEGEEGKNPLSYWCLFIIPID